MAMRLACEHPNWVAGVGVVAATMSNQIIKKCNHSPGAMVFVFGDKDTSFLVDGQQVNPVKPSQLVGQHVGI